MLSQGYGANAANNAYADEAPRPMTLTERLNNELNELIGMLSESCGSLEETFSRAFGPRPKDEVPAKSTVQAIASNSESEILNNLSALRARIWQVGDFSTDLRRRL